MDESNNTASNKDVFYIPKSLMIYKMGIVRYICRQTRNLLFRFRSEGIILKGKGIVGNIKCINQGVNNVLIIDAGASLDNCILYFKGNGNTIHICSGSNLKRITFWFEDDNNNIEIGSGVSSEENLFLAACESKKISIGNDCMFSNKVQLRTSDSHSILDENTKRINPGNDIEIGNHVWIGTEVIVLKGATIPENCIVGARSIVTSSLNASPNSMITGMPARVVKTNINWSRERI